MLNVVLDTNVILAAYLTRGAASKIIKIWAEGSFDLLISEAIVREYLRVLLSQNINPTLVSEFNSQLDSYAKLIHPKRRLNVVLKDADDDKFFECAVEGGAEYIVSHDKHLLEIGRYKRIKVLTVRQFLNLIEK